jgi:pyridoxamine 5'-phosphate oxidase
MAATGRPSLLFYWGTLTRQVSVSGGVERLADAESDIYFASRPIESQWSVYASDQSAPVASRELLESQFDAARARYGGQVPRPAWWGGFRVLPEEFEFWQGRPNRLHDRIHYMRDTTNGWIRERLAP